jgi:hypothetical protein
MHLTRLLSIAALMLVTSGVDSAFGSPIVYSQPALFSAGLSTGAVWTSERPTDEGALRFQTFDNFSLTSPAAITEVTWQGIYIDDGPTPPVADATAFEIYFYADAAGLPGAQLYSTTLGISAVNETYAGNQPGFFGHPVSPVYNYSAVLPSVFSAGAATQYWFSVVAQSPTFRPNIWAWTSDLASTGDGSSYQFDGINPQFSGFRSSDRAFELIETPEPTTLVLLGTGLAAVLLRSRRRPQSQQG